MSAEATPKPQPVRIDQPDLYQPWPDDRGRPTIEYGNRISGDAEDLKSAMVDGLNEYQQMEIDEETIILGINPVEQPERFSAAHYHLMRDANRYITGLLEPTKQKVIDRTAGYFAGSDDETKQQLSVLLAERTAATNKVVIVDSFSGDMENAGAELVSDSRQILMSSLQVVTMMYDSESQAAFDQEAGDQVLAHELLHAAFTIGAQAHRSGYNLVRQGLQIETPGEIVGDAYEPGQTHAGWLNEATLESFRQTIMETSEVSYEFGVSLVNMLDGLSPGLRDRLVLSALDVKGPGPVFGEVETLLGPLGIEAAGEALSAVAEDYDINSFNDAITALLPAELQEQGRALLLHNQESIFTAQADYQEVLAAYAEAAATAKQERMAT